MGFSREGENFLFSASDLGLGFLDVGDRDFRDRGACISLPLRFSVSSGGFFGGGDGGEDGGVKYFLRASFWGNGDGGVRGTFCIFQGRGEFIEKYYEMIGYLLDRNYCVAVFDWCGQGGSSRFLADGLRGHIEDFSFYDRALECFMEAVGARMVRPFYAFAHSMGGLILLRSVLRGHDFFSRIILSSPMLGFGACHPHKYRPDWKYVRFSVRFLRFMGLGHFYVPFGGGADSGVFAPFADNAYTYDRERYEILREWVRNYPSLMVGSPTVCWLESAFSAMESFMSEVRAQSIGADSAQGCSMDVGESFFARASRTMAIIWGGDDYVISPSHYHLLQRYFPSIRLFELASARHDLLYERPPTRARFWEIFDDLMEGK